MVETCGLNFTQQGTKAAFDCYCHHGWCKWHDEKRTFLDYNTPSCLCVWTLRQRQHPLASWNNLNSETNRQNPNSEATPTRVWCFVFRESHDAGSTALCFRNGWANYVGRSQREERKDAQLYPSNSNTNTHLARAQNCSFEAWTCSCMLGLCSTNKYKMCWIEMISFEISMACNACNDSNSCWS